MEGVFDLPAGLFDDPDLAELSERMPEGASELVLARRVSTSGRTSAYVQGRSANVADLRTLGSRLLAFYGQHEHRKLTLASAQLDVLDGFAGPGLLELRERYRAAHLDARSVQHELDELREREGTRERDLDLMRFELEEIDAVAPDPGELDELGSERDRLRHSESLREAAAGAVQGLSGGDDGEAGALAGVSAAESSLGGAGGVDRELDAIAERVGAARLELADLASDLRALRGWGGSGARPAGADRGAAGRGRAPRTQARRIDRGRARACRALPGRDRAAGGRVGAGRGTRAAPRGGRGAPVEPGGRS